jgi:hypothetical protein
MTQNEIEAEYDDPKEIIFRKMCIYCQKPATIDFHLKEQSKIDDALSRPWLSLFFLFLVFTALLSVLMPTRSVSFPAIFLAGLTWQIISGGLRKAFKNLFRNANVYVCDPCFSKWRKQEKIHAAYWGIISAGFLILVILSFLYNPEDLKSSNFAVSIFVISFFGVLFGSGIIGFIEGLLGLRLNKIPLQLNKQGIIKGTTKLTMLEDNFNRLVVEDNPESNK